MMVAFNLFAIQSRNCKYMSAFNWKCKRIGTKTERIGWNEVRYRRRATCHTNADECILDRRAHTLVRIDRIRRRRTLPGHMRVLRPAGMELQPGLVQEQPRMRLLIAKITGGGLQRPEVVAAEVVGLERPAELRRRWFWKHIG